METLKTKSMVKLPGIKKSSVYRRTAYVLLLLLGTSTSYASADMLGRDKRRADSHCIKVAAVSDKEISSAIKTELGIRKNLATESISVSTVNGIVSLTGTTQTILSKDRAEQIALAIKGVRGVINQIQVKATGKTDQEIQQDVEKAMLMNPATDSYEVKAKVTDGKVILTGKVDSWAESQLATTVAKKVKGVRQIENNTEIVYKSDRSDMEIAKDIKLLLRNDIRVGDAMIDVKVNNGAVSLSGTVGSASEKIQAQYDAWVAGVKSVSIDNLKVDPEADFDALRKDKFLLKTDVQLKEAVADALLLDPRVNSLNIMAAVNNGQVTLTGTVDNLNAKQAAEEDTKNVVGVMGVTNNITIELPKGTQAMLKENVDWALLIDPVVEKYEIKTTVNDGSVTLNGTVDSYFEKVHAEDMITQLAGVSDVKNNLNVKDTYSYLFWYDVDPAVIPAPKESDAEIKEDIKNQIWWSPFVDYEEVTVEVKNGKAILQGTVDSWSEEQSAIENAFEGGAVVVDSNLKINNN